MYYSLIKRMVYNLLIIILIVSCSSKSNIKEISDLDGKRFGIQNGSMLDKQISSLFSDVKFAYLNNTKDGLNFLNKNEIDVFLFDEIVLRKLAQNNKNFRVLDFYLADTEYAIAVRHDNLHYRDAVDKTLDILHSSGIYEDMKRRWLTEESKSYVMPEIRLYGRSRVLKFGTSANVEPFSFLDSDGNVIGFDIELAYYIAQELDMSLEIYNMSDGALIPSLLSSRIDMMGGCISISEERAKRVLFSKPYYTSKIGALIKK